MIKHKKFAVIGATDEKYADFVINHWSVSLLKNIDNHLVDIIVLDYGLRPNERKILSSRKIKVIPCKKDGIVCIIRFRDILKILKKMPYEQILCCDSGDIIFQKDITPLFTLYPEKIRAVSEESTSPLLEWNLINKTLKKEFVKKIGSLFKNKPLINVGVFYSNKKLLKKICKNIILYTKDFSAYGPDQIIFNYVAQKEKFKELPKENNFIIGNVKEKFSIRNGKFYNRSGKLIRIVHNAGRYNFLRIIKNFGYGKNYNKMSYTSYYIMKFIQSTSITLSLIQKYTNKLFNKTIHKKISRN